MRSINRSQLAALGIFLVLSAWLLSGLLRKEESLQETPVARPKPLLRVEVNLQRAQAIVRETIIYGRTAPSRTVVLRAETAGRIVEIGRRRGSPVSEHDLIARIEMRDREANLKETQAVLRQRELEYEAAQDLANRGFQAETKLAEGFALREQARAAWAAISLDIEKTAIAAPFPGLLHDRKVEIGDYVQVGDEIATIIELDPLIITGEVTEHEVGSLEIGQTARAVLATGELLHGDIRYISPSSDPGSRTFSVELEVRNGENAVRAGVTGKVTIPGASINAHRVSPALLTLDDGGNIGIKFIDERNIVRFLPAIIVKSYADAIWLSGLPETTRIITVGQGFARIGERVQPVVVETPVSELPATLQTTVSIPGTR